MAEVTGSIPVGSTAKTQVKPRVVTLGVAKVSNPHCSQFDAPGCPGAGATQVLVAGPPSIDVGSRPTAQAVVPASPGRDGRCSHHRSGGPSRFPGETVAVPTTVSEITPGSCEDPIRP